MTQERASVHDLIGIGFGPSNLALAIALQDSATQHRRQLNCCFVERQPGFLWHGDMLLENSRMQISFLKDLVTLRNPQSPYTFINYLHAKHRLADFINLKTFFPSRHEFNDYLAWVAAQFAGHCAYGEEVVAIEPVLGNKDQVDFLRVVSTGTEGPRTRLTRNLVIGVGGYAHIPQPFAALGDDARVFHSSTYLHDIRRLEAPQRLAVIGAGQSAVEIFLDLQERFPQAAIDLICRSHALKPSDDSPFVNEIFNAEYVDYLFTRPESQRRDLLREFENTNYAAGDIDLIQAIYELFYRQKVRGNKRLQFLRPFDVVGAKAETGGIALTLQHCDRDERENRTYDAVILATGYGRDRHRVLLDNLRPWLGDFKVDRSYRLQADARLRPAIFLQGACEDSHGLSDTLLSILPVRAQEITAALHAAAPWPETRAQEWADAIASV